MPLDLTAVNHCMTPLKSEEVNDMLCVKSNELCFLIILCKEEKQYIIYKSTAAYLNLQTYFKKHLS